MLVSKVVLLLMLSYIKNVYHILEGITGYKGMIKKSISIHSGAYRFKEQELNQKFKRKSKKVQHQFFVSNLFYMSLF